MDLVDLVTPLQTPRGHQRVEPWMEPPPGEVDRLRRLIFKTLLGSEALKAE